MRKQIIFSILIILIIISMFDFVSAGGGAAVSVSTIDLTDQGNDYTMKPGRLKFEFNEKLYAIQLRRVKSEYAEFLVMTLSMDKPDDIAAYTLDDTFNLLTGEKKEIDLDKDGTKDIFVKLNEIMSTGEYNSVKSADFSIEKIITKTPEVILSDDNIYTNNIEVIDSNETAKEYIEIQQNLSYDMINESILEPVISLNQKYKKQPTFLEKIINFIIKLFN